MLMFVGGEDNDVEVARAVLEAMGEIRRVGTYANGYVAKLVNNQLGRLEALGSQASERAMRRKGAGVARPLRAR